MKTNSYVLAVCALAAGFAHAQNPTQTYPTKPIRFVVGFGAGGGNDMIARTLSRKMTDSMGQQVVVDNRAGGAGIVAAVLVASIRLPFLDPDLDVRAGGQRVTRCDAAFAKGEEMGWFEHGSTIVVLAPTRWQPCHNLIEGAHIHMGEPLLRISRS